MSPWKQRPELIDSRASTLVTGADVDTENLLFPPFFVHCQNGREIKIKTWCIP